MKNQTDFNLFKGAETNVSHSSAQTLPPPCCFYRKHAMTDFPRRPLMNDFSRTGYRSYTSPNDRLSKRLGASLPNLEQPVTDTATAISSNRAASLRKMTPDVGQCCWRKGFKKK